MSDDTTIESQVKEICRGDRKDNVVAIHGDGKIIIIQDDEAENYVGQAYPISIYLKAQRYDMAELDHAEASRMEQEGIPFEDQDPYRPDPDLETKKELHQEAYNFIGNLHKDWKNFAYHVHVSIVNMQEPGVDESGLLNVSFHSTRNWRELFQPSLPDARSDIHIKRDSKDIIKAYRDAVVNYPTPPYINANDFNNPEELFDWARNCVVDADDWWLGYRDEEEDEDYEEGEATQAAIEAASSTGE